MLLLSSCQSEKMLAQEQAIERDKQCFAELRQFEFNKGLSEKIHLSDTVYSHGDNAYNAAYKLALRDYATEDETQNLLARHQILYRCRTLWLEDYGRLSPLFAPLYTTKFMESDANLMELLARRITWGEWNLREMQVEDRFSHARSRILANPDCWRGLRCQ